MKLDLDRLQEPPVPDDYVQSVAGNLGSLMQLFGLQSVKLDIRKNPVTSCAVVTDASVFDFAGASVTSVALSNANAVAQLAASAGIIRLSISDVSKEEKDMLVKTWSSLPAVVQPAGRLAPPPDVNPDMAPIEVDL